MYTHETQVRVRYAETDQMGVLYHGTYTQYYEIGRVEAMRAAGISYKEIEGKMGIFMPVVSINMRFVRPAHYDEVLTIRTSLRKLPDQFITFHMEIFNPKGKLTNGGKVRLCFMEAQSRKSIAAPEPLLEKLRPFF